VAPARQPHGPNNGFTATTAPHTVLPPCRSHLHRLKKEHPPPPPVSSPFPPLPLRHHYAVVPPSLSHCEMPPWSLSEPPVTTLSSALTPGAPSTSVSVPSAASLLHHRRSPPLGLHRRGTRHSGEPSPLFGRQTGPSLRRLALRPLHRRPPFASRSDFTGKSPVPTGEKATPVSSRAKRLRWAGPL
jgi:hypothetical protein